MAIQIAILVVALAALESRAASNVVQYSFDAAGNIVAIQRANLAPVAISGFSPAAGPVGATVTISGSGFAPAAAGNAVTFNGTTAAVSASTATTLTATVPAGATSGRIAVAVGGNAATSAQDFAIASPGAPTIAAFAPASGAAGTVVSVTGTNFNPVAGATTVRLNQAVAAAASVTASQLSFTVPAATGSGKIRVATALGSATSDADFIVPPPGVAAADIVATARLVPNGAAQSVGLFAFNKFAALLFDGNPGDWLSLQFGSFAINPSSATIAYTVYRPDGTKLSAGTLFATNLSIHLPQLPLPGTYAVVLSSGAAQVSLAASLEINRVVPADGSMLAVTRDRGQTLRALVAASAGEQKALSVAAMAMVPDTGLVYTITTPGGSIFRTGAAFAPGGAAMLPPFTATGTHPIVLTPSAPTTRESYRLSLLSGLALPIDGAAASVAFAVAGAGARLNIAATAGDNLGFGVTGLSLDPASTAPATFTVYKPDATALLSGYCYADGTYCSANLANLPVSGTYGVIVQPPAGATGKLDAWLSRDATGTLVSGAPLRLAIARPGQNARLAFAGATGTLAALQVRAVATAPVGQGLLVQLNRPDGSTLASAHLQGAGQTIVAPVLPATGTYTLFIEPEAATKGAATATMEVLLDPGQAIAVDGPTVASTIAVTGGSARFTFTAAAGQNLGVGISGLATTPAVDASVSIYGPTGKMLVSLPCSAAAGYCGTDLSNLAAGGTYGIEVYPGLAATGALAATVSTDLAGTLAPGAAFPVILDRPGRNARLSLAGTAGQLLRLEWTSLAVVGTTTGVAMYLYGPDGSRLSSGTLDNASGARDLPALPTAGTYVIVLDPPNGTTMKTTLTLAAR